MKYLLPLLALFLYGSTSSFAITWEVIGQASKTPVYHGESQAVLSESVGAFTVKILQEKHIPFHGTASGIASILNTPTGDDATVIVSNDTMRVYGWCVDVNGVLLEQMPDKEFFANQHVNLRWFFAFSLYEKGVWKSYCVPAYTNPLKY